MLPNTPFSNIGSIGILGIDAGYEQAVTRVAQEMCQQLQIPAIVPASTAKCFIRDMARIGVRGLTCASTDRLDAIDFATPAERFRELYMGEFPVVWEPEPKYQPTKGTI